MAKRPSGHGEAPSRRVTTCRGVWHEDRVHRGEGDLEGHAGSVGWGAPRRRASADLPAEEDDGERGEDTIMPRREST